MRNAAPSDCLSTRIARVGGALDRGEWASAHALLGGLQQCGQHHSCPNGEACALAAEMLMADLRGMVRDQTVAA